MVYNRESVWFHLYTAYEKMIVENAVPRPRRSRDVPAQHRRPGVPDLAQLSSDRVRRALRLGRASRSSTSAATCRRTSWQVLDRSWAQGASATTARLASEHREFLRSLTFDFAGRPMHAGPACRHRRHVPPAQALGTNRRADDPRRVRTHAASAALDGRGPSVRTAAILAGALLLRERALGPVPAWMRRIEYDAIVFHTSFLSSLRWGPEVDDTLRRRALELNGLPGLRAALPQDEFLRSGRAVRLHPRCRRRRRLLRRSRVRMAEDLRRRRPPARALRVDADRLSRRAQRSRASTRILARDGRPAE